MSATIKSKKRRAATPVTAISLCLLLGLPVMAPQAAESDDPPATADIPVAELEPATEALSEAESQAWAKHAQTTKIPQAQSSKDKTSKDKAGKPAATDETAQP